MQRISNYLHIVYSDDKDRGTQVGLVLSGIKKFVLQSEKSLDQKFKIGKLIIDTVFRAISAFPCAAGLTAVLQPATGYGLEKLQANKIKSQEEFQIYITKWYNAAIDFPIFADGSVPFALKDGSTIQVKVKVIVFQEWLMKMMQYNGFPII